MALIMSLLAVDQVAMKSMRIIRPRSVISLRPLAIAIMVDPCKMVIDDNNAAYRLHCLDHFRLLSRSFKGYEKETSVWPVNRLATRLSQ